MQLLEHLVTADHLAAEHAAAAQLRVAVDQPNDFYVCTGTNAFQHDLGVAAGADSHRPHASLAYPSVLRALPSAASWLTMAAVISMLPIWVANDFGPK